MSANAVLKARTPIEPIAAPCDPILAVGAQKIMYTAIISKGRNRAKYGRYSLSRSLLLPMLFSPLSYGEFFTGLPGVLLRSNFDVRRNENGTNSPNSMKSPAAI